MRRIYIFAITLFAAVVCISTTEAQAQNRRVEVTKAYSPEVTAATKIIAPTVINDTPVIEPDIEYNVLPDTWRTTLSAHDFSPVKATYWDFASPQHFYLMADAGYPLSSDLMFRYAMQVKRLGYLNVGVNHAGDYAARANQDGVMRKMANSFAMRNGVDVSGGLFVDKRLFEAKARYDHSLFNRYAEVADPARLNFHDANIALRFGDAFVNLKRLNFSIEAHGGYWAHRLPVAAGGDDGYGEASVGASVKLARIFTKKNRVELNAFYDMLMGGAVYRDMRFGIDVGYARRFNVIHMEAGVGYMFDKVLGRRKASHFITPHAKVLLDLKLNAFTPYVELDTRIGKNGVASLYRRNPYIDFVTMAPQFASMANDRSYNLSIGFTGNVHTRFAYRAYFGVSFVRDYLLFYVNPYGNFNATTTRNTRLVYGAEVEYMPIGGLRLGGSVNGFIDKASTSYVINDPAYEANLYVEYTLRRWQFGISSDFVGKRQWSRIDEQGALLAPIEHRAYIDLGARVSFRATNDLDIFVEGVNLLNAKIYDYANYYQSGIGFKAGVRLEF